jgi:Na+-transporting NADH:ubiquinone oxidoreductase subunit C
VLVTVTAVHLKPLQKAYQNLERNRAIVAVSGLTSDLNQLSDREVINLFQSIEARIIELDTGKFDTTYSPDTFETWLLDNDVEFSIEIPMENDLAKLARRSRLITIYLVKDANDAEALKRMIFPIYGQGMWSKISGFIALEYDLNSIADITFYQQGETAGIGDKILSPDWQSSWQGRKLYDETNTLKIGPRLTKKNQSEPDAVYQFDAISGATVTVDSVKNLVRYWFGSHGYETFLNEYRSGRTK